MNRDAGCAGFFLAVLFVNHGAIYGFDQRICRRCDCAIVGFILQQTGEITQIYIWFRLIFIKHTFKRLSIAASSGYIFGINLGQHPHQFIKRRHHCRNLLQINASQRD